ncbi:MAG: nitroreductase family deazaflavin-dependent oxidoreductase [Chloroflexi bacterium]|nr:nitroreductase family deazaflavin-dependent oxidoreductase [Chloroflexota bacterium]
MPAPLWLARFNRRVTNRLLGPLAPWFPSLGMVIHVGRRTGRRYRTPVTLFPRPGGYVIALTYGRQADWVRNVLARGCLLQTRGRTWRVAPRLVHDARRRLVPLPVRPVLRLLNVADFLELTLEQPVGPTRRQERARCGSAEIG